MHPTRHTISKQHGTCGHQAHRPLILPMQQYRGIHTLHFNSGTSPGTSGRVSTSKCPEVEAAPTSLSPPLTRSPPPPLLPFVSDSVGVSRERMASVTPSDLLPKFVDKQGHGEGRLKFVGNQDRMRCDGVGDIYSVNEDTVGAGGVEGRLCSSRPGTLQTHATSTRSYGTRRHRKFSVVELQTVGECDVVAEC